MSGYLDYAVDGNIIFPLLFQESELFLKLIDDSESGKIRMVHKLRAKKKEPDTPCSCLENNLN